MCGARNSYMLWSKHLVVAVDKSQQSESNGSGSKTHKSQGPRLMALNIAKSPGAKHTGGPPLSPVLHPPRLSRYASRARVFVGVCVCECVGVCGSVWECVSVLVCVCVC